MLKSKVGFSIDVDSFKSGEETAKVASHDMRHAKLGMLYTSILSNAKEVVKGVRSVTDAPIIGCTSSGAIIVPEGIVSSDHGFSGMMMLDDKDMTVGVACHEAGKNALWPGSDRPFQHAGHAILPAAAHIGANRRKRGAPRRDAAASGRDGDHLYKRDRVGFRRDCFG